MSIPGGRGDDPGENNSDTAESGIAKSGQSSSGTGQQPEDGDGGGCWVPKFRVPPRRRNAVFGCLVASYTCCSCQFCCREPYPAPWSGEPHHDGCGGDCCNGCDRDCRC